jgi:hypothetical protein
MNGVNLEGAHLEMAILVEAQMEGAYLRRAHLEGVRLWHAHLEGADLEGVFMQQSKLEWAYLKGAILVGAHIQRAWFWWAHLEGANFYGAHLEGAELDRAHLEDSILTSANLEGAKLFEANLEGAKLGVANLEGANVSGVKYNRKTKFQGCRVSNCYGSPRFRAFAMHQDFLEEMRKGKWWEKGLVALWNVIADCGRTPWLWMGWSVLFAVYFGFNYFWMEPGSFNIPKLPQDNVWTYLYYSVVTFTTLGFGDVTPNTLAAARWVMAEVILGYVMLGGLISIFATLITPRR